jgi:hypothetical protein
MHWKSLQQTIAGKLRERSSMGGVVFFDFDTGK